MFAGINMFWTRLRLILTRAVRRELKWAEKGRKHIYAREHKLYYYYYHFGGHWEKKKGKKKKKTTKQSERSRERLQVEWLLFSLNENTQYIKRSWLEISKFIKDMKGKFDKAYLEVLKLIVQLLNWQFGISLVGWTECVWLVAAKFTCTSPKTNHTHWGYF